jgi:isoquinoline 1-oxidoreductase beta subunit
MNVPQCGYCQAGVLMAADDTRMVVAIAKEYPGVPVKVIWSREEMMKQGRYRTPIVSRFRASLDDHGMPLWSRATSIVIR